MLPLTLLNAAQSSPVLVELKNGIKKLTLGETFNGHLVNCDSWMNINLKEVILTSPDGQHFTRIPEIYIKGNTIKYLRIPETVVDKVKENQANPTRKSGYSSQRGGYQSKRGGRGGRGGRDRS